MTPDLAIPGSRSNTRAGDLRHGTRPRVARPAAWAVEGGGFEPPKAPPTDLQSVPFGRSGTPPQSLQL